MFKRILKYIEDKRGCNGRFFNFIIKVKDFFWKLSQYPFLLYKEIKKILFGTIARNFIKDFVVYKNIGYLTFSYDGEYVYTDSFVLHNLDQETVRSENVLKILDLIIEKEGELLKGKKCIISFADEPREEFLYSLFDVAFSTTTRLGRKSIAKPFPCPYSYSWPAARIDNSDNLIKTLLESTEKFVDSRIFWVGGDTHFSRRKLKKMSDEYPDIFDVTLEKYDANPSGRKNFVHILDHAKYKYLIDCPGWWGHYSARLKWLLATGRPVFIVEREVIEWWHKDLIPFIHYIPVKEDLSDLIQQYEYIESHPELYEKISKNAIEFARKNLMLEQQLELTFNSLKRK